MKSKFGHSNGYMIVYVFVFDAAMTRDFDLENFALSSFVSTCSDVC